MRALSTITRGALIMIILLSMASASTQRASAKGVVGLQHVWNYLYSAGSNEVVLNVTINEWNPKTQRIIRKLGDFAYSFECQTQSGFVTCNMDIQSSIEDAYDQVGHPQSVGTAELYDRIITEATGTWSKPAFGPQATLASHSAVSFGFRAQSGNTLQFSSWGNATGQAFYSQNFQPVPGDLYVMGSVIEKPMGPNPGGESFYLKYNGQDIPLGKVKYQATPSFQLSANQLQITPVDGFALQSFLVDPKIGHGG